MVIFNCSNLTVLAQYYGINGVNRMRSSSKARPSAAKLRNLIPLIKLAFTDFD